MYNRHINDGINLPKSNLRLIQLENVILKSDVNCIRFWKSVVELAQSKDERILQNLVYNLPGILSLASFNYSVDPICDVYVEMFYDSNIEKMTLAAYFHEMVRIFPKKHN